MVTMAQCAANWRNTHTQWIARIHSRFYINTVTTTWCEASAQWLFFSACWVFSCFRKPPDSDMDYRIFNVVMVFRMRAYTHGGWAHRQRISTFWLWKTHKYFYCAPGRIRTFVLWNLACVLFAACAQSQCRGENSAELALCWSPRCTKRRKICSKVSNYNFPLRTALKD